MVYSKLLKYLIVPTVRSLQGRKGLSYWRQFESSQWLNTEELERLQWKKFKKMLYHAYHNVPYYNRRFRKIGLHPDDVRSPSDLLSIPILTKADIRENVSDLIAKGCRAQSLYRNSTSGSTGENLFFYQDSNYGDRSAAVVIRNDRWFGLEIGDRWAELWGSRFDQRWHNTLTKKAKDWAMNRLFLLSYNLTEEDMHRYAIRLKKFRPKAILAYPSALCVFADLLLREGIDWIRPLSIISCSETLFDYQKDLIESVFHCKVYNRYGCREFSCIAQECSERSGLHINVERVFLEVLRDGRHASEGELGEFFITDLDNFGMPFIRYKIGDIGTLSGKLCACGRGLPLLERVEGRVFDVVVAKNGRFLPGTFWTLLFRSVEGIRQFQVIQREGGNIHVKIAEEKSFDRNNIATLESRILDYMGEDTEIDMQIVDEIKPTKSGKLRFVISEDAPEFGFQLHKIHRKE